LPKWFCNTNPAGFLFYQIPVAVSMKQGIFSC
jgi:hypothetical protein